VKRQVSYHISALTDDELKQLENRRKKTSELLELFSFSLADRHRWMPSAAESLFRQENSRVNTEAKGVFSTLIAGDLDKFMAQRREQVKEDASRMYRDLFPHRTLSEDAVKEIMAALQHRFEEAQHRSFLPDLSFNRVSLPQPQDSTWKSQLGSALHLLLSIARYPRKACRNGPYFARGMKAKPKQILDAMNLLDDPFLKAFDRSDAEEQAEAELDELDAIEASDATAEKKCEQVFELLGQKIAGSAAEPPSEVADAVKPDSTT
jgi:DNA-binding transcriptional ArsR family regulator